MSYTVKIVDNATGEVICDHDDVTCILAEIGCESGIHHLSAVHCTPYLLCRALNGIEDQMNQVESEHTELRAMRQLIRIVKADA